jgi:hypothetical protein
MGYLLVGLRHPAKLSARREKPKTFFNIALCFAGQTINSWKYSQMPPAQARSHLIQASIRLQIQNALLSGPNGASSVF